MHTQLESATKKRVISLTDQAYSVLREKIITGELEPGSDVFENEFANELEMSKTPVREALGRLCLEGLMEAYPRRGYRVTRLTIKDMNDLFAVRGELEGMAAALAAVNMTADELDVIGQLAHASYIPGENASTKDFVDRNKAFHLAIAQASRNPRLHSLVMGQLDACDRYFYMGTHARDINPETNSDHHHILAALRERNADSARLAIIEHNENTRRGLLNVLVTNHGVSLTL